MTVADATFVGDAVQYGFTDGWSVKMIEDGFNKGCLQGFVAEEGAPIGFITFSVGGEQADVADLFVLPTFRRKGVGNALMEKAERRLKENGVKKIFLEVRQSNAVAVALYGKCGFEAVGIRKKYYADGGDAIVMCKEITL